MWEYNYPTDQDELYHYGVLGMRWGARRASRTLSKATTDKKRDKAVSSLQKHGGKIEKKLVSLSKSADSLKKTRDAYILKHEPEAARLAVEAANLRNKKSGLLTTKNRAARLEAKALKLDERVKDIRAHAEVVRTKLEQNKKYQEIYSQGLRDIDTALVSVGKKYVSAKKKS